MKIKGILYFKFSFLSKYIAVKNFVNQVCIKSVNYFLKIISQ